MRRSRASRSRSRSTNARRTATVVTRDRERRRRRGATAGRAGRPRSRAGRRQRAAEPAGAEHRRAAPRMHGRADPGPKHARSREQVDRVRRRGGACSTSSPAAAPVDASRNGRRSPTCSSHIGSRSSRGNQPTTAGWIAVRAPLPEAELADQPEPLRIAEPRAEPELVFDDAAPERDAAEHRRAPGPAQQVEAVRAVEAAGAVRGAAPRGRRRVLHTASAGRPGSHGRPRPATGRSSRCEPSRRPVSAHAATRRPARWRSRRAAPDRASTRVIGVLGAGSAGSGAGAGCGLGGGDRLRQGERRGLDLDDPLGLTDVHRVSSDRGRPSPTRVPPAHQAGRQPVDPLASLK